MKPTIAICLLLLSTTQAFDYTRCRGTFALTDEFCANVPTAPVDSAAFTGTWFQIFLTRNIDPDQSNQCTTLNYTLQSDGTFAGLNCELRDGLPRPLCFRDAVVRRPDGGPGSFSAVTGPISVNFDVVGLLGSRRYGYFAAAVFGCIGDASRAPGYFIWARKPFFQRRVLKKLIRRLKCLGYPVPGVEEFVKTQVRRCKYFFNEDGFDEFFLPGTA